MLRINCLLISIVLIASATAQTQRNTNYIKKQVVPFFKAENEDSSLYLAKKNYWLKEDSVWFINTITNYKYDGNGNNIEEISEYYNPNYDIPTKKYKRIFDSFNRLIDEILLHDNYGSLESIQRQTYFYDSLLTMTVIYELLGNNLQQSWRTKYFYNSEGNLFEEIDQEYGSPDWVNEYKNTYSYNYLEYKINKKFYQFYEEIWNFVQQDSFFYDSQNRITKDILYDESGKIFSIYETLFNSNSKEIIWYSGYDDSLVVIARWVYNYDIDSTLKEILTYENRNNLQELSRKWEYIYAPLSQLTDVRNDNVVISFYLYQNYPNPFNPSTKIIWQTPVSSWQTLKVYDVLGNEITTLVNEYRPAGNYGIEFYASHLPSGVYFYQLRTGDPSSSSGQSFVETKKMILLK